MTDSSDFEHDFLPARRAERQLSEGAPAAPSPSVPEEDAGGARSAGDVRTVMLALRRHWWMLVAGGLAGLGVATYLARSAEPVYQARAVVRLSEGRRAMTGGLVDGHESSPRPAGDPTVSLLEVLTSRAVAGHVVDGGDVPELRVKARGFSPRVLQGVALDTGAVAAPQPDTVRLRFEAAGVVARARGEERRVPYGTPVALRQVRFTVTAPPGVEAGLVVVLPREQAIDGLIGRLRAKVRPKTDVIDVTYTARDPGSAQHVVNAVVTTFRDVTARAAQQQSRRRREFIERQLQRNDSLLAAAEWQMDTFRREGGVYDAKQRLSSGEAELSGLERQATELGSDLRMYQGLLDRLSATHGTAERAEIAELSGAPGAGQSPVIAQLYTQLVNYQAIRDSLTTGPWARSPGHPDVLRVDTLISTTEGRIKSAIESHIAALRVRLSLVDEQRGQSAAELQELPRAELEEARLQQQLESLRKLTDGLRTEYQKAQIEEAVEVGQVEVLDMAPLPRNPVGLAHMTLLLIGLVMGALAGGGAAVASDQANTSIRRRDEIRSVLRLPELATIPRTVRRAVAHPWGVGRHAAANGKSAPALPASRVGSSLAMWNADRRAVEAYRVLRTSLSFSTHLRSVHTLVVTSAAPREGKTTVAANLAATYAQQGGRVLLIDADVRHPSAHSMLGVPQGPGLAETLAGRCGLEETVRATEVENLFVLPAGGVADGPAEPLEAIPIFRLLATLASRFDLIVVDSPPVLVAADAAILGAAADAVVFVVRAGQTRRHEARDALRQLAAVGARVVGAALNDPDMKVDDHAPAYAGYGYSADAYAAQHV